MLSRSEIEYLEDIDTFEKERGIDNAKTVRSRIRKSFRIAKNDIIFVLDHDGSEKSEGSRGKGKQRIIDLNELTDLVKHLADYTNKYVTVEGTGTDIGIKIEERNKDSELELIDIISEIIEKAKNNWGFNVAIMRALVKNPHDVYDHDYLFSDSFYLSDFYMYLFEKENLMKIRKAKLLRK